VQAALLQEQEQKEKEKKKAQGHRKPKDEDHPLPRATQNDFATACLLARVECRPCGACPVGVILHDETNPRCRRLFHSPRASEGRPDGEQEMRMTTLTMVAVLMAAVSPRGAAGAEIKVLSAGAFKQVLLALLPEFEKQTGHKATVDNDTVGALVKRVEAGENFDLAVLTPGAIDSLSNKGKFVAGSRTNLARVGIGVVVREGTPKPDIGSDEAFKKALLAAKSIAYIDPAAGGSSGIYVAGLLDRLGIAAEMKGKSRLIPGGAVAEHIARGEAELGIHQISEILPVKGVTLVGPLPADIQNYTVYAAAVGANAKAADAARDLLKALTGPAAAEVLKAKGMNPP
jgi:molybdate transport system substrate-binding protein